jgi:hypothetical protein
MICAYSMEYFFPDYGITINIYEYYILITIGAISLWLTYIFIFLILIKTILFFIKGNNSGKIKFKKERQY